MLTLDVLGGVGGPACHNKGLWRQSHLPWEHDTLVCHWLVSDNANHCGNCPIKLSKLYYTLLVGQSHVMPKADSIVH